LELQRKLSKIKSLERKYTFIESFILVIDIKLLHLGFWTMEVLWSLLIKKALCTIGSMITNHLQVQ